MEAKARAGQPTCVAFTARAAGRRAVYGQAKIGELAGEPQRTGRRGQGCCPPGPFPTTIRRVGSWLVTFRGGLSDDARDRLSAAGTIVTGGHGGGFLGPSGDNLEPLENHTVLVDAETEGDAIRRIRTALEPHGGFGHFSAHESGAP